VPHYLGQSNNNDPLHVTTRRRAREQ
jgi:hypothetical protein